MTEDEPRANMDGLSLEEKLGKFQENLELRFFSNEAPKRVYAEDLDERIKSRGFLSKIAAENGSMINYEDPLNVKVFADAVRAKYDKITYSYFGQYGNSLIEAVKDGQFDEHPESKLAKIVLSVAALPLDERGKEADVYNAPAQRLVGLGSLLQNYKAGKIDDGELAEHAKNYVIGIVEKALSVEKDPQNAYLTNDIKKMFIDAAIYSLRQKGFAAVILGQTFAKGTEEFKNSFKNGDKDKSAYVAKKLSYLNGLGGEYRENAMKVFYGALFAKERREEQGKEQQ